MGKGLVKHKNASTMYHMGWDQVYREANFCQSNGRVLWCNVWWVKSVTMYGLAAERHLTLERGLSYCLIGSSYQLPNFLNDDFNLSASLHSWMAHRAIHPASGLLAQEMAWISPPSSACLSELSFTICPSCNVRKFMKNESEKCSSAWCEQNHLIGKCYDCLFKNSRSIPPFTNLEVCR